MDTNSTLSAFALYGVSVIPTLALYEDTAFSSLSIYSTHVDSQTTAHHVPKTPVTVSMSEPRTEKRNTTSTPIFFDAESEMVTSESDTSPQRQVRFASPEQIEIDTASPPSRGYYLYSMDGTGFLLVDETNALTFSVNFHKQASYLESSHDHILHNMSHSVTHANSQCKIVFPDDDHTTAYVAVDDKWLHVNEKHELVQSDAQTTAFVLLPVPIPPHTDRRDFLRHVSVTIPMSPAIREWITKRIEIILTSLESSEFFDWEKHISLSLQVDVIKPLKQLFMKHLSTRSETLNESYHDVEEFWHTYYYFLRQWIVSKEHLELHTVDLELDNVKCNFDNVSFYDVDDKWYLIVADETLDASDSYEKGDFSLKNGEVYLNDENNTRGLVLYDSGKVNIEGNPSPVFTITVDHTGKIEGRFKKTHVDYDRKQIEKPTFTFNQNPTKQSCFVVSPSIQYYRVNEGLYFVQDRTETHWLVSAANVSRDPSQRHLVYVSSTKKVYVEHRYGYTYLPNISLYQLESESRVILYDTSNECIMHFDYDVEEGRVVIKKTFMPVNCSMARHHYWIFHLQPRADFEFMQNKDKKDKAFSIRSRKHKNVGLCIDRDKALAVKPQFAQFTHIFKIVDKSGHFVPESEQNKSSTRLQRIFQRTSTMNIRYDATSRPAISNGPNTFPLFVQFVETDAFVVCHAFNDATMYLRVIFDPETNVYGLRFDPVVRKEYVDEYLWMST